MGFGAPGVRMNLDEIPHCKTIHFLQGACVRQSVCLCQAFGLYHGPCDANSLWVSRTPRRWGCAPMVTDRHNQLPKVTQTYSTSYPNILHKLPKRTQPVSQSHNDRDGYHGRSLLEKTEAGVFTKISATSSPVSMNTIFPCMEFLRTLLQSKGTFYRWSGLFN